MLTLAILCGGNAHRLKGYFEGTPKPLIKINALHLIDYIINPYIKIGVKRILLLVGEQENKFIEYAISRKHLSLEFVVLQTGYNTPTGGRIKQAENLLIGEPYFYLTYGDGIANIDIETQTKLHTIQNKLVTLAAVKPTLPYGVLAINEANMVQEFREKPISESWINGGFYVLNPKVLSHLALDTDLEQQALPLLSSKNEVFAYKHLGNWQSLDTYKDYLNMCETLNPEK